MSCSCFPISCQYVSLAKLNQIRVITGPVCPDGEDYFITDIVENDQCIMMKKKLYYYFKNILPTNALL